jgi:hypothetical protein
MANIDLGWEVKGSIEADESVRGMLKVIEEKDETGSFWCWDGRVSNPLLICVFEKSRTCLTGIQMQRHPW